MIEIRRPEIQNGLSTRAAYDQIFSEGGLLQNDSFYMWLLELLAPSRDGSLLDISCGQGRLLECAQALGVQGVGVDFSIAGLLYAQRRAASIQWVAADGTQLPFPSHQFDYVAHIGSLEHYEWLAQGAAEIARMLKPTGRACVLLPNVYGLFGNIQYVARTGEVFDDGQPLQRYGTLGTWQALLERGGLTIESIVPYGEISYPRTRRDWLNLLLRPHKVVRGAVASLLPIPLANHFVFLCRLATEDTTDRVYPTLTRL